MATTAGTAAANQLVETYLRNVDFPAPGSPTRQIFRVRTDPADMVPEQREKTENGLKVLARGVLGNAVVVLVVTTEEPADCR